MLFGPDLKKPQLDPETLFLSIVRLTHASMNDVSSLSIAYHSVRSKAAYITCLQPLL